MQSKRLVKIKSHGITDEKYFVAFLDILGYKEIVKDYVEKKTDIVYKIRNAFKEATSDIQLNGLNDGYIKTKLNQFSDCTSIAIHHPSIQDPDQNKEIFLILIAYSLVILSRLQTCLLTSNLYIRCGLSLGLHYENDNMIFSEGLINSYELESKAVYPRIIIDNNLLNSLKSFSKTHKDIISKYCIDKLLISDWDGLVFINPFNLIEVSLANLDTEHKRQKAIKENEEIQLEIINNVEKQIKKYKGKEGYYNVLRKYLWLNELIKWNKDKNSSKIRFEYFLK